MPFVMKVFDFHSMDGHAARQSSRLSMMRVYYRISVMFMPHGGVTGRMNDR